MPCILLKGVLVVIKTLKFSFIFLIAFGMTGCGLREGTQTEIKGKKVVDSRTNVVPSNLSEVEATAIFTFTYENPTTQPVETYLKNSSAPPRPIVNYGPSQVKFPSFGWQWNGIACGGASLVDESAVELAKGTKEISFNFPDEWKTQVIGIYAAISHSEGKNLELTDPKIVLPFEPGIYLYTVNIKYKRGDSYGDIDHCFKVKIQ